MNKKAYVQDFLFFGIILFIIAIMVVVGGKLISEFNGQYQSSSASTEAKDIMTSGNARYSPIFDNIFMVVFVLFALTIFVTFFLLDTHPALFFVVIIVFAFILIPIGLIGNVYEEVSDSASLNSTADNFTLMSFIMEHWTMALTVIGFMGIILLFAKLRTGVFR